MNCVYIFCTGKGDLLKKMSNANRGRRHRRLSLNPPLVSHWLATYELLHPKVWNKATNESDMSLLTLKYVTNVTLFLAFGDFVPHTLPELCPWAPLGTSVSEAPWLCPFGKFLDPPLEIYWRVETQPQTMHCCQYLVISYIWHWLVLLYKSIHESCLYTVNWKIAHN